MLRENVENKLIRNMKRHQDEDSPVPIMSTGKVFEPIKMSVFIFNGKRPGVQNQTDKRKFPRQSVKITC